MTSENSIKFGQLLVANGCHITKSRSKIFTLLDQNQPRSIRDILETSNGSVDRVSLYRNIALFEKLGIVQRVYIGWKYKLELTDHFVAHHHHLSCMKCSKVTDIEDEEAISAFIQQIVNKYSFISIKHQFEIEGYCEDCRSH